MGKEGFSTRAVHAGEAREKAGNAVTTAIFQTATYVFRDSNELIDYMEGNIEREEYGRYGNPTQRAVERKLAALDGGEAALLFSTGMCAITTTLLAMLGRGSHLVLTEDGYRRTRQFCRTLLHRLGIECTFVETGNYEALEASIRPTTRLIFSESPTNPHLRVMDLERLVAIGRERNVKIAIDSTFATPYNQRPLDFGIDLVIHSATKYLGGHNDLMAGVVVGSRGLVSAIRDMQAMLGGITDPHTAYLLLRGMKTLGIRLRKQNENGMTVARFLEGHPRVRRVYYPGLSSHPDYKVACEQMKGFGGVVSFEIDGDMKTTSTFIDRLHIPYIAPSLGGVETLIEQPALMSYFEMTSEDRAAIGIADQLVRLSLGVEDADDLVADLEQALTSI
ncbi:MAG TPA: aminotransferase class I/II-fold pyridoxal phosphate-dependent enzyme [Candidatus Tectomicrobia bacterium]|jgi:cystathionine gamma-synthase|nr:aminotransferase class I/II-fold pyridoxal phosphate-dependent enzyme [Candidatus Tectomicrobia bacterium]